MVRAIVEVYRAPSDGFGTLDLPYNREVRLVSRRPTTRTGDFALHVPVGLPLRLVVDVPGFAVEHRNALFGGQTVEVKLSIPSTWTGRLVRDDGQPMANALVRAWRLDDSVELFELRTDDAGAFRVERLKPGRARVSFNPVEASIPAWQKHTLVGGEALHTVVEAETGVPLRGRILDAETGEPIAGAEIAVGWVFRKLVRSRADGRYELLGIGGAYDNSVHVRAPGYVQQQLARPRPISGPIDRDFRLEKGFVATGRILDIDGKPAEGVYVAAVASARIDGFQHVDWPSMRTGEDGTYRLIGLRPALNHVLLVRRDDRATLVIDFPSNVDDVELEDVTLRERRVLRGRVARLGRRPAGRRVRDAQRHERRAPAYGVRSR